MRVSTSPVKVTSREIREWHSCSPSEYTQSNCPCLFTNTWAFPLKWLGIFHWVSISETFTDPSIPEGYSLSPFLQHLHMSGPSNDLESIHKTSLLDGILTSPLPGSTAQTSPSTQPISPSTKQEFDSLSVFNFSSTLRLKIKESLSLKTESSP